MRTVLFWMHLTTGMTIGVIVLIMAATGVLLTYQRQIQAWADTHRLDAAPPTADARPLDPDRLLARVRQTADGTITGVRWHRDRAAPVEVQLGRERTLFVHAYTGAVLGEGSARARAFFRTATAVHRWLALRGDSVQTGRAITGAANLAFLFMVLSGFVLWWPRNLTARAFRSIMLYRGGLRAKARDFNWHNVTGFWSLVPLVIIIASAVATSYGWAGSLIERIAGSGSAYTERSVTAPIPPVAPGRDASQAELLARARAHVDNWRSITMQLPARGGAVTFVIDAGTGAQPHRQGQLTVAAGSGAVVSWQPFASESRAGRVRSILRYVHTGEVAGVAGQTLAGLVSAGAVLLVWTGLSLALRRFSAWRKRRRRDAPSVDATRAVPPRRGVIG